ncbi:MAG: hypothetical protein HC902_00970 [Calothrix sp. SM1_5_4]|nr:hypothetical protein [Calothrix sp. SM1_5_4]
MDEGKSKNHLKVLRSKLKFIPSNNDLIEQWVVAVTGEADSCDIAMMRHVIWQVKRKLCGLPVEHHALVCIFGASGAGKSVAIQKLLEPITSVTIHQNMTVFNDQFSRRMFTSNYCMVFDEMGKAKQVDIDCLKNIITANPVEWRGIQSESIHSGQQNCTFIAASNIPLCERIKDTTSARRFWQLNCKEKLDWNAINSIDYLAMWRSVNENDSCPILDVLDQVRRVQERDLRVRDPIEEWIASCCRESDSQSGLTTSELFQIFKCWCSKNSVATAITIQKFSRDLPKSIKAIIPDVSPFHSHRGTEWPILVTEKLSSLQTL